MSREFKALLKETMLESENERLSNGLLVEVLSSPKLKTKQVNKQTGNELRYQT